MMIASPPEVYDKELQALREEIERKTGKTPEQLYKEREKRVTTEELRAMVDSSEEYGQY